MEAYPHLAATLQQLPPACQALWGDEAVRWQTLSEMILHYANDDARYRLLLDEVDAAVTDGLVRLGLPRGPVNAVRLTPLLPPDRGGRKQRSCNLLLSAPYIRRQLIVGSAESVWATWVHESLHARQRFTPGAAQEATEFAGYEEGVVEGLTRIICGRYAGMTDIGRSYEYFPRCYEALAAELRVNDEALYRALWTHPPGAVRERFFDTIRSVSHDASGRQLEQRFAAPLRSAADILFRNANAPLRVDVADLVGIWRSALT